MQPRSALLAPSFCFHSLQAPRGSVELRKVAHEYYQWRDAPIRSRPAPRGSPLRRSTDRLQPDRGAPTPSARERPAHARGLSCHDGWSKEDASISFCFKRSSPARSSSAAD